VASFALLGFSNAVMWPAIFPLALKGLGRFTKIGAAFLIMGIVGGAVLPPLYGKIGEAIGHVQHAYRILLPCYVYILFFALKGHKIGLKYPSVKTGDLPSQIEI
jgi:fucose permease